MRHAVLKDYFSKLGELKLSRSGSAGCDSDYARKTTTGTRRHAFQGAAFFNGFNEVF
jgi:hypothetical protein